jgi:hypothetical protein
VLVASENKACRQFIAAVWPRILELASVSGRRIITPLYQPAEHLRISPQHTWLGLTVNLILKKVDRAVDVLRHCRPDR